MIFMQWKREGAHKLMHALANIVKHQYGLNLKNVNFEQHQLFNILSNWTGNIIFKTVGGDGGGAVNKVLRKVEGQENWNICSCQLSRIIQ